MLLPHHQLQPAITDTHLVCLIEYGNHVHTPRATGHINWCHSDQDSQPVDPKQQETTKRNQLEEKSSIFFSLHTLQSSDSTSRKGTGQVNKRPAQRHKGTDYNSKHNKRTAENTTGGSPRTIGAKISKS